jgi:hypothetical protein
VPPEKPQSSDKNIDTPQLVTAHETAHSSSNQRRFWLVAGAIAGLLIAGLGIALAVTNASKNSDTKNGTTPSSASQKEPVEKLELTTFTSKNAQFTMKIPKGVEADESADEVFEDSYSVDASSSTDEYGNRYVDITREAYGADSLELTFDQYKESMREIAYPQLDYSDDSVFESDMDIVSEKERTVSGYRAYDVRLSETVQSRKKGGQPTTYNEAYLFVYVDGGTSYTVYFKSQADDKAFQATVDDMIDSFKIN